MAIIMNRAELKQAAGLATTASPLPSQGGRSEAEKPPTEQTITISKSEKVTLRSDGTVAVPPQVLYRIYSKNEVTADELFKDHSLEISGIVERVAKDIFNSPYVTFRLDKGVFGSVQCIFARAGDQTEKLATLVPGKTATIRGKCTGKTFTSVILTDCSVVTAVP